MTARWRLALRLAFREAVRARARTALTLTLIGLPVAALVAAGVLWKTAQPGLPEQLNRALGTRASAVVVNSFADMASYGGNYSLAAAAGLEAIAGPSDRTIPDRSRVLPVLGDRPRLETRTTYSTVLAPGTAFGATIQGIDPAAPLADGLFRLSAGRWPHRGEVVVNAATAHRGFPVGHDIRIAGPSGLKAFRIVGIAESRSARSEPLVIGPDTINAGDVAPAWLVGGPDMTWTEVLRVVHAGGFALSRDVVLHPPAVVTDIHQSSTAATQDAVTAIIIVFTMALIELVLLAGPAFAVGARRQARSLALIGASGGTPQQVRRVVLASAVVLGSAAAVVGAAVGIGVAPLLRPVLQEHQSTWFGPTTIPWKIVAAVMAFGFVSAWLAAVVPAWTASRQDVVAVLAGRRGDGRPLVRTPVAGVLVFLGGTGAAALGARSTGSRGGLEIAAAAVIAVIGMIMTVPAVVAISARLARGLPLPVRFAMRDAVRHRTRTVPAVAAIAATMSGILAILLVMASYDRRDQATYTPNGPLGQGQVSLDGVGKNATAIEALVRQTFPGARLSVISSVDSSEPQAGALAVTDRSGTTVGASMSRGPQIWVTTHLPATVTGWPGATAANRVLEAGGAVTPTETEGLSGLHLTLFGDPQQHTVDGVAVATLVVPHGSVAPTQLFASPAAVAKAGLKVAPYQLLIGGATIDQATQDRLNARLSAYGSPDHAGMFLPTLYVERGYQAGSTSAVPLVLIGLGLILMLGGTLTATALALADARPDLATLAAVGARPLTRRAIAGAYALTIGWIGALLGSMVGLVPGLAAAYALASANGAHYLVFPWLEVGAIAILTPVATACVVAVVARSRLPMLARAA